MIRISSILSILFFSCINLVNAQVDSVRINGKINNLNGKTYREASTITFSRNNLLRPNTEFSKGAPLNPDGSFEVTLPLVYDSEEIYLDYGGKAYSTFLGSKGTVSINFDAQKLGTSDFKITYTGVNSEANNQYPNYIAEELRLLKENKSLGEDFYKLLWNQSPNVSKQLILERSTIKLRALANLQSQGKASPTLVNWISSLVADEQNSILTEYALSVQSQLDKSNLIDFRWINDSPLTYQKVIRARNLLDYANQEINAAEQYSTRRNTRALTVETIATLIKDYTPNLDRSEVDKLNFIIEKKNVDKSEMDWLSKMYKEGGTNLSNISNFERDLLPLKSYFEGAGFELLTADFFLGEVPTLLLGEQENLYKHLHKNLFNKKIKASFDELALQHISKKSIIEKVLNAPSSTLPQEVAPGIFLAQSNENGRQWMDKVQEFYAGKTLVLVNWDLYNERSLEEINKISFMAQGLSKNYVFIYLHMPDIERIQNFGASSTEKERTLWQKNIASQNIMGTHMFFQLEQMAQLSFRNAGVPRIFSIIRPNGKFQTRNEYLGADLENLIKALDSSVRQ